MCSSLESHPRASSLALLSVNVAKSNVDFTFVTFDISRKRLRRVRACDIEFGATSVKKKSESLVESLARNINCQKYRVSGSIEKTDVKKL